MILQNQLYTISDHKTEDGKDIFTVALNPECFIYKAHFRAIPSHRECASSRPVLSCWAK